MALPIPDPLPEQLDETALLAAVVKLDRQVRDSARLISRDEARLLVSLYYGLQEHRLAIRNQDLALQRAGRPHDIFTHFGDQMTALERQMQSVLNTYSLSTPVGRWSRSVVGIGPVIAAGLEAHIDITRAPTVGHIWRFAGLDPTVRWGKGERRPWNADLKVLCWKAGDSFVKVSGRPDAYYGQVYRERKAYEVARDEAGGHADAAAATLAAKNITDPKTRKIYESGHLPPGRLDLRARRYATKLFLSHWHEVAYEAHHGAAPPLPYPIARQDHAHKREVPKEDHGSELGEDEA